MPPDVFGTLAVVAPVILISVTAFGAAEVHRHGRRWFAQSSHSAGADAVEVRSVLLVDPAGGLPAIARTVRDAGLAVVYSSADPLWPADGTLDVQAASAWAPPVDAPWAIEYPLIGDELLTATRGAIDQLRCVAIGMATFPTLPA